MDQQLSDTTDIKDTLTLAELIKDSIHAGQVGVLKDKVIQLETCFNRAEQFNIQENLIILSSLIRYFRKVGNYEKCVRYGRKAISFTKKATNKNLVKLIEIYFEYSEVELEYGQYSQARILLAQLLQKLETHNWQNKSIYGQLYYNLGKINFKEENYEAGISQLEMALNLYEGSVSPSDPLVNKTVSLLVKAWIEIKEYKKGIDLYTNMLTDYQESGERDYEINTLLNIAEMYYYIDLAQAKDVVEQAIELLCQQQGHHPNELKAYMMHAEIEEHTGNHQNAVRSYERSLNLLTATSNEGSLSVFIYSKIGSLLYSLNDFDQAKVYLNEGLKQKGPFTQAVFQMYFILGKIHTAECDFNKANEYFKCLLEKLSIHNNGNKTKGYGHVLQMMAYNYLARDEGETALMFYNESLEVFEQNGMQDFVDKGLMCTIN